MPPRPAMATTRYLSSIICPGVKRPPPMGSEPVSFEPAPLLEGARGDRVGVGAEESLRGVAGGAMVSCSAARSFESMVAAAFRSRAPPQAEQNRPVEETCAPQEEQYMEARFYHCGRAPCELWRRPR